MWFIWLIIYGYAVWWFSKYLTWTISMFFFSVKERMATGYDVQGNEESAFNLGWAGPAGQMYSTLNDLMKVCTYMVIIAICALAFLYGTKYTIWY